MISENESYEPRGTARLVAGFAAGMLLGALAGGTAALLTAPQSGRRTRRLIRARSAALRDQAVEAVNDTVDEARQQASRAVKNVQTEGRRVQRAVEDKTKQVRQRVKA